MSMTKYVSIGNTKRRKMESADSKETAATETGAAASDSTGRPAADSKFVETKGDLFSCSETESIAHCISADIAMGKGIAVIFKKRFGGVQELKNQGQKPGGLAFLKRGNRFIYYLVTKEKYFHKPTYKTLEQSLQAMLAHCERNNVESISMPRIGCGLDGLQWSKVWDLIQTVFKDSGVNITVYTL